MSSKIASASPVPWKQFMQGNSVLTLVAGVVLALALITIFVVKRLRNPLRKVPGPWYSAWTAYPLEFAALRGRRMHYVHELHQKYGPYVLVAPNEVAVSSPEALLQIHKVGSKFSKSPWYHRFAGSDREVLFTMQSNAAHAHRRKLFSRPFSKANIQGSWEDTVHENVRLAVTKIKEAAAVRPTDVLHWWTLMANDISSQVIYGDCFDVLKSGQNDFLKQLETASQGAIVAELLPLIGAVAKFLPFKAVRDFFDPNTTLNRYGENAVSRGRTAESKHVLAQFIEAVGKDLTVTERDLVLEASSFLLAGTDTSAKTLTYVVWAVLSHPQWHQRLKQEISSLPEAFTADDVDRLPVLNAIIDETMRLYAVAPSGLPRVVPAGGFTMDGYFFDEGTTLTTQAYTLHRNSNLFPEPEKFEPSRWLESENSPLKVTPAARAVFHPFSLGSRACLGMHLARLQIRLATVEFFRSLGDAKLAPSTTGASMNMIDYFIVAPKAGRCEIVI